MHYSPLVNHHEYKLKLISKVESLIKRMRWKVLQFFGKLERTDKETFGFKSRCCPPTVEELCEFENDMMELIHGIQFKSVKNRFQQIMKQDIANIKKSPQIFVSADKS